MSYKFKHTTPNPHFTEVTDVYPQEVLENEIYNHAKTYVEIPHDADLNFAQKFIEKDGKFIYCTTKQELGEKLIQFIKLNELRTVFLWEESIISLIKESDLTNEIPYYNLHLFGLCFVFCNWHQLLLWIRNVS